MPSKFSRIQALQGCAVLATATNVPIITVQDGRCAASVTFSAEASAAAAGLGAWTLLTPLDGA